MRISLISWVGVALLVPLTGCVTSSPDNLFATDGPVGQAQKSGRYPKIGEVPVGQTTQLTPTEKIITKRELQRDAVQGKAQAAQNSQTEYAKEVAAMRKLAAENKKKVLQDIEDNNRIEQPEL